MPWLQLATLGLAAVWNRMTNVLVLVWVAITPRSFTAGLHAHLVGRGFTQPLSSLALLVWLAVWELDGTSTVE